MFGFALLLIISAIILVAIFWLLGMIIHSLFGYRIARWYNSVVLSPLTVILTPVFAIANVVLEIRFYLVRDKLFDGVFGIDQQGRDQSKQDIVWRRLENLRLIRLHDGVNVGRAKVAKYLTAKDCRFFEDLAERSHQELRFACKVALACGYRIPQDLGKKMRLGLVMRTIQRASVTT